MTKEEAVEICKIAENVDSGCPVCVGKVLDDLQATFPEHSDVWKADRDLWGDD